MKVKKTAKQIMYQMEENTKFGKKNDPYFIRKNVKLQKELDNL